MKAETIKAIDRYIGIPLCAFLAIFKTFRKKSNEVRNILAIVFWGIGSSVNTLPVLRALKKMYPNAKLTVITPTKNADLLYNNKHIDDIILIDMNIFSLLKVIKQITGKYDLVVDMEHWLNISAILSFFASARITGFSNRFRSLLYSDKIPFNPEKHAVLNNMELARQAGAYYKLEKLEKIETSNNDKKFAEKFLRNHGINEKKELVIGICPASGETVVERRWPKEKFAELADRLVDKYKASIIFIGSENEKLLINNVQALMKNKSFDSSGIKLGQSIALIDKCKLFISNDTGPMHIAAAQGIKTIGLFGPETPVIFGPFGKDNIAIYKNHQQGPTIKIYEGVHRKPKEDMLDRITVNEVFDATERLIRRFRGGR